MKNTILLVLISLIYSFANLNAESLTVQDPQETWKKGYGTVEEAIVTVKPAGVYMAVDMYLTYSARGNNITNADTLEVQHFFDLPANVLVTDSWLWMGDTCIIADLIDRWKASLIYEGIVKRRRDPSILFKNSATTYEFRIFPMAGASTRRVKLTFMIPIDWTYSNPILKLPLNLITISKYVPNLKLYIADDAQWGQPSILGSTSLQFTKTNIEEFGECWKIELTKTEYNKNTSLEFKNNSKGIYCSKYEEKAGEGYYQMVFSPRQLFDLNEPRKIAVLVDYDAMKTNLTVAQVKDNLKSALKSNLTTKDSFNIFFSNLKINKISQNWIIAHPDTIDALFANIPDNILSVYSNLQNLLFEGVAYAKENGDNVSIFLAASSDQLGYIESANPFVTDLLEEFDNKLPIFYIADYASKANKYTISGTQYYGNQYLYNFISKLTKGSYLRLSSGETEASIISKTLNLTNGQILSMDWTTSLDSGFTYANYNSTNIENANYAYGIGRYWGDKQFKVKVTGFYRGAAFMKEATVNPAVDTIGYTKQLWTGNFILALEKKQNTNEVVAEIIDLSMNNRVLSLYTAFLALDPAMKQDTGKTDDTKVTGVDDDDKSNSNIKAQVYPNPFDISTSIKINIGDEMLDQELEIKIIDGFGNVVKNININGIDLSNEMSFSWDGSNDNGFPLPNGVYWLVVKSSKGVKTTSVVLMR